jgi:lipoprotein-anchoring transpeptidase ErfK/SrfK
VVGLPSSNYKLLVNWLIQLDGGGPRIFAARWWSDDVFGNQNRSHYEIGLRTADAQWLYEHLAVGDQIQIR